jgi:molybdate/tungstate transport system substrate-binding protein
MSYATYRSVSVPEPHRRLHSRRDVLRNGTTAVSTALAGCLSVPGAGRTGDTDPVSILAAGSLQRALSDGLAAATPVPVRVEAHGSATVARLIAEDKRQPDIVSVADPALFTSVLHPSWYTEFASNALVIAYDATTADGQRVESAGRDSWYQPVLDGTVDLGRTDPDRDPLGYRTLFMLELATRYYADAPELREQLPDNSQVYPETSLLSRFEVGALDAAVVYRNMAVERGYDYIELPDQIDLSNPQYVSDWYATVSYTLPENVTIQGDLIGYVSTIRRSQQPVVDVFSAQVTGEYLRDHGFLVPDRLPRSNGDVPDTVTNRRVE